MLELGDVTIDLALRTVTAKDGELRFTPMEFRVMESLARQAGMIVSQHQLMREAWGPDRDTDTRSLRVFVRSIRQKIEPDPSRPRYLLTEAGLGYTLLVPGRE